MTTQLVTTKLERVHLRAPVLLIDNYDSFTFNLYQFLAELGGEVEVIRNDARAIAEIDPSAYSGIVISPGPCTPSEAGISLETVAAFSGKVPIFGVCLGHQSIVQQHGGKIVRAPKPVHGKASRVRHNGHRMFAGIDDEFDAGRYHSLIADNGTFPEGELEVTARLDDIIMAVAHREEPTWGVQFHPESILTPEGKRLLRNFLELCAEYDTKGQG